MKRGYVYLVAFMDWFSRYILSWKLSITLEKEFCIEAAQKALQQYGIPAITNSDQGDRKSTRLNSSHIPLSRMPSSA